VNVFVVDAMADTTYDMMHGMLRTRRRQPARDVRTRDGVTGIVDHFSSKPRPRALSDDQLGATIQTISKNGKHSFTVCEIYSRFNTTSVTKLAKRRPVNACLSAISS
jgi:transposase